MNDPKAKPIPAILKRLPWPLRVVFVAILGLALLGAAVMLPLGFGFRFLPSEAWVAQARPWALGLGIVEGLTLVWLVGIGARMQGRKRNLWTWLTLVFTALMGFWLGANLLNTGPALVGSLGQTVAAHEFTVRDVRRHGSRRCRDRVRLENMPFMANEVCGVPDEMLAKLAPGMRVEVTGAGNALGLRPGRIRLVP